MPKKFVGENSKAVAARLRKENNKVDKEEKHKKMLEDEAWRDDDKQILKKQQKKEEQERKRQEQLQKKAEAKALLEKELQSIKVPVKAPPPTKVTRAQISSIKEKENNETEQAKLKSARITVTEEELEENLNRVQLDGEVAQSVDEAISILSESQQELDKHPEKRMKAAYAAFEDSMLPQLKQENPTLRLSQLKQLLRKEWLKSPQNPLNQKH